MDIFDKHYSAIWKALIRPPRQTYKRRQLGPSDFYLGQHACKRYDIAMTNSRNKVVEGSYYKLKQRKSTVPVVIYLHGNSSSRLTAINYANELLMHFNVFTVDLSGSGRSEGEYIGLGYHEKDDLKIVIQYLRQQQGAKQIFIWGRSMGAVTGLIYASKYKNISGLILDSPFSDLQTLVKQAASSYVTLPDFILNVFIQNIRQHIKKLMLQTQGYEFDILKLKPINDVSKISIPTYFIVGKQDKLVNPEHTISLHRKCSSKIKKLEMIDGGHNGPRPKQLVHKIIDFLIDNSTLLKNQNTKIENIDIQNQFQSLLYSSNKIIQENQKFMKTNKSQRFIKLGNKKGIASP